MATTVYFIRHGTTASNIGGRFQGSTDIPLGEMGLKQAQCLGERFRDQPLDAVYCSPLTRARQTAEGVCTYQTCRPVLCDDLREIDGGRLEGRLMEDNKRDYPEVMRMFRDDPAKFCPPGGETTRQVYTRMTQAVERLVRENDGKKIAVVSHGYALQTYLSCLGRSFEEMQPNIVGNASVTCVEFYGNGAFRTVFFNDQSHIPEELRFCSPFTRVTHAPGE